MRYLSECGITPEAFKTMIKNPQDRAEALRPMLEAMGGELEEYYFAVGQHTIYAICQYPDEVTAEAFAMAVLAGGAVSSMKATPIVTAAEAVAAMKKAADAIYKPPAS